jgi:pyroglutamyl-peptidase
VPPDPITLAGPLGRIDHAYSLSLAAEDPTGEARTWALASGLLPPGLTVDPDGEVTGAPRASGSFEAEIWGDGPCGEPSCRLRVTLTIEVAEVILLSGYGPFEGVDENPSWLAVAPLDGTMIGGYDVRVVELPVLWEEAPTLYLAEYARLKPVLAIGSGVAMGELIIRLEARAQNWAYGEDVSGVFKPGRRIDPDEPEALYSTLPLEDLRILLEEAEYPVGISDDAGTYLCNYLFFKIMQRVAQEPEERNVLGGFVHVPGKEVVSIPDMTEAWERMLEALVAHHQGLGQKRTPAPRPSYNATVHHPPRY